MMKTQEINAKAGLKDYFEILSNFTKIQNQAATYSSYLFALLGYKFTNHIKEANFYHYASEAYILCLFSELKDDIQNDVLKSLHNNKNPIDVKYSYNDILIKINDAEINEAKFMKILEFLLGTEGTNDSIVKVTQLKLAQLFLKKVKLSKKEIIDVKSHANLTRTEFEDILINMLRKGLNYTLNELDPSEEDKSNLILFDSFKSPENHEKPTFGYFVNEINKRKGKTSTGNIESSKVEIEIVNPYLIFYNFSIVNFSDFLVDIDIFIEDANSIIYKIKQLLAFYYDKSFELFNFVYGLSLTLMNSAANLNVIKYLESIFKIFAGKTVLGIKLVQKKKEQLKDWINSSFIGELNKDLVKSFKAFYINNIFERYIKPSQELRTFLITNTFNFAIDAYGMTKTQIDSFILMMSQRIQGIFELLKVNKEKIFGPNPLFKIIYNNGRYIDIEINKNLNLLKNQVVANFINDLFNQINEVRNLSITDLVKNVASLSQSSKIFLLKSFMNILTSDDKSSPSPYNK